MESDIYVKLAEGATVDSLREKLAERYADEPFVCVLPKVHSPHCSVFFGSGAACACSTAGLWRAARVQVSVDKCCCHTKITSDAQHDKLIRV